MDISIKLYINQRIYKNRKFHDFDCFFKLELSGARGRSISDRRKNSSIIFVVVHWDRLKQRGRKSRIHLQYASTGLDLYVGNGTPYVFLRSDRFSLKTPSHASVNDKRRSITIDFQEYVASINRGTHNKTDSCKIFRSFRQQCISSNQLRSHYDGVDVIKNDLKSDRDLSSNEN